MSATHPLVLIVLLGAAIGFLGGLLGKGGSAIATPFLVALGVPPIVAVVALALTHSTGRPSAAHHLARSRASAVFPTPA